VGVVKGEDGKDGADGKDGQDGKDGLNGQNGKDGVDGKDGQDGKDGVGGQNSACEHQFSKWETQIEPTCTSIGYKTRTCSVCGAMDYDFIDSRIHTYGNSVDVVNIPCERRLVNTTCSKCGDTKIEESYLKHLYDENGVCIKCGDITHFIESDEYISKETVGFYEVDLWMSIDGTYGLYITTDYRGTFIYGYKGTPINVIVPPCFKGENIISIGGGYGYGGVALPFYGCQTIESIKFPYNCSFFYESFKNSSLKKIYVNKNYRSTELLKSLYPDVEILFY
jgi:hypothetical protein